MSNKHLTKEQKEVIKKSYLNGNSYRDIREEFGYCYSTISRIVKGLRSHKDSVNLARKQGKCQLTEEGRRKLSEVAKKRIKDGSKMWTKPEREFRDILTSLGYGVKFSEDIKSIFSMCDDVNAIIYFQYPIQRYICDFAFPEKKIVFRVMGDYWHANPKLYQKNNLTRSQQFNITRDINKRIFLEKNGWQVIDIWESDIYWRKELVKKQAIGAVGSTSLLQSEGPQFESEIAYSDEEWTKKLKEIWFKNPKGRPKKEKKIKICPICKKDFEVKKVGKDRETKYCSHKCWNIIRRKVERPSKEQLLKEIKETNYCAVGRKYDVTDNAIRKWLK